MSLGDQLKRVRAMLSDGWARGDGVLPRCLDVAEIPCSPAAEDVAYVSTAAALRLVMRDDVELLDAWAALEQVHSPARAALAAYLLAVPSDPALFTDEQLREVNKLERAIEALRETELWTWLERPERRLAEVLRLFDLAILRATSREAA